MRWLALGLLLLLPAAAAAEPLTFRRDGRVVRQVDPAVLVQPVEVTVQPPNRPGLRPTYRGYPFQALMDAVYGPDWRQGVLVFHCTDGYEPTVPGARFASAPAVLAFAEVGGPFTLQQRDRTVPLGPYFLVWPEAWVSDHDWPWQLDGVDVTAPSRSLAPPAGSPPEVLRGEAAWREHCMVCHPLNGVGGRKGPELNRPASVTEYIPHDWLVRWISAPETVREGTLMPGLPADLPDRDRVIADLISYLKAMARR